MHLHNRKEEVKNIGENKRNDFYEEQNVKSCMIHRSRKGLKWI